MLLFTFVDLNLKSAKAILVNRKKNSWIEKQQYDVDFMWTTGPVKSGQTWNLPSMFR